jgi:hypothetical protein
MKWGILVYSLRAAEEGGFSNSVTQDGDKAAQQRDMSHVEHDNANVVTLNLINQCVQYNGYINANFTFKGFISFSEKGSWSPSRQDAIIVFHMNTA